MRLRELAKYTASVAIAAMVPTAPAFAQTGSASTTFQVTTNLTQTAQLKRPT